MIYKKDARKRALEWIKEHGPAPTHYRIAELAGSDRHVLELGCATGYVSKLLKAQNCTVTGIELDEEAANEARDICDTVITGDLTNPALFLDQKEKYDVVLAGDILEHLPNPEVILENLHSCLKPGGFVLVSMPNVAYWNMRWQLLIGRFNYQDFGILDRTHLRFYTVRTLQILANETGYKITGTVINDAGFPGSLFLEKVPGIKIISRRIAHGLAKLLPNLFTYHAIYKFEPVRSRE